MWGYSAVVGGSGAALYGILYYGGGEKGGGAWVGGQ
jgi:hypothetical protein